MGSKAGDETRGMQEKPGKGDGAVTGWGWLAGVGGGGGEACQAQMAQTTGDR